ncbi:MAG: hypothetical protein R2751_00730 [Bacteroidales bacterium]
MRFFLSFPVLALLACSCTKTEPELPYSLPLNMNVTLFEGTNAKRIIADFHYRDEDHLLDHITWSNHQTHYFQFDEADRLALLTMVRVDAKEQEEWWFRYGGAGVERVDVVKRNLDYIYLEPLDSIYQGSIRYEYDKKHIVKETRMAADAGGETAESVTDYTRDKKGNILSKVTSKPGLGVVETLNLTYDGEKHPYADLPYYFSGESFVNNALTLRNEEENMDFEYEVHLNALGYPESIYETLGSANTRIIRYTYLDFEPGE